ncbi:hypothetical protein BC835DRAFT_1296411, partial [Cytidiella melzeri]
YRQCVSIEPIQFVKYGNSTTLEPEFATRNYIYTYYARRNETPDTSRIARIHYVLGHGTHRSTGIPSGSPSKKS